MGLEQVKLPSFSREKYEERYRTKNITLSEIAKAERVSVRVLKRWFDHWGIETHKRGQVKEGTQIKLKSVYPDPVEGIIWKEFQHFLVSSAGQVFSRKKGIYVGTVAMNGYAVVIGAKRKHYYIHRIVASLFLDNFINLPEVNHIDGNKQNNNVTNLEWCSRQYNQQHAYENNMVNVANGSRHPKSTPVRITKGDFVKEFSSQSECKLFLNVGVSYIRTCMGKKRLCRGYIIEKI